MGVGEGIDPLLSKGLIGRRGRARFLEGGSADMVRDFAPRFARWSATSLDQAASYWIHGISRLFIYSAYFSFCIIFPPYKIIISNVLACQKNWIHGSFQAHARMRQTGAIAPPIIVDIENGESGKCSFY